MWSYQVIEILPAHCLLKKLLPILDIKEKQVELLDYCHQIPLPKILG
ncbi:hypothetical protein M1O16_04960 [Dehalococcoidia bacterium]|nr:hypothetical protein [Dehalococcoidia bacterium]MCL0099162.1 hypothetical protein [Dehalococcoidia bacterium]